MSKINFTQWQAWLPRSGLLIFYFFVIIFLPFKNVKTLALFILCLKTIIKKRNKKTTTTKLHHNEAHDNKLFYGI